MMQKVETSFVAPMVKETLSRIIARRFPAIKADVMLQNGPKGQCEYVSPAAMKEFNMHKNKKEGNTFGTKTVVQFATQIVEAFEENDYIGSLQVNQKGFLKIKVKDSFIEQRINSLVQTLDYPAVKHNKVVVDFSSPNVAKEMHVGHLRSTIIGESICRMLEYMGDHVIRSNHIGDWGTQFGMLIAFMREEYPDYEQNFPDIRDLDAYYKVAREKFDKDPAFKKRSQETVVKLQAYGQSEIKIWKLICQVSRQYFNQIYKRLGISLNEYGESFYNPFIPALLEQLHQLNMIEEDDTKTKKGVKVEKQGKKEKGKKQQNKKEKGKKEQSKKEQGAASTSPQEKKEQSKLQPSQKPQKVQAKKEQDDEQKDIEDEPAQDGRKAKCIFLQKYQIPLIVVKSDGGYNYDTTDMAAVKYRLQVLKADRAIYITDNGQHDHFEMIYAAARKAGWLTTQRFEHMGFGCVLSEQDGKKFKTRHGKNIKLLDLLNQAKQKAFQQLKNREKGDQKQKEELGEQLGKQAIYTALKPEQYEDAAEKLGIAAIKYFDLKQNRLSDYIFSFEKMLDPKGNTAVYLIYAYVRMCSIIRKSGLTSAEIVQMVKEKPFRITHPEERVLAGMLIKYYDTVHESVDDLALNKMTDFIYDISVKVQENYKRYRIVGDPNMHSRIILCEAIRKVLQRCFYFVGIVPLDKI